MNQSLPVAGNFASPGRLATSTNPTQVFFVHGTYREPAVESLAAGQSIQGYLNTLCSSTSVSPSSAPVPAEIAARITTAGASSAPSFAVLGSQDFTLTALPDGTQLVAWVTMNSTTLFTAIRSADGSLIKNAAQYPVGPNSQNVMAADFNGDGIIDLAVSDFGSLSDDTGGNVRIFLGKSDGSLTTGAVITSVNTPVAMHAGDFNGDGKTDLAVADVDDDVIAVLLGNGDGTFQAPIKLSLSGSPHSIIAADLNNDGKLDIASANYLGGVSVFLNNGTGTFKSEVSYKNGIRGAHYIASADMNGDGKLDLIVSNPDANAVAFLFGNGDGTFQAPYLFSSGAEADDFGLALAADGALVISRDNIANTLVTTPVTAGGVPSAPQLFPLSQAASGVAAGDLNGDKYPDMIAAGGKISVLLRNPAGGFQAPVSYTLQSGSQAVAIAVGDMNGDGKNDIVTSSMFNMNSGAFGGTVDVALGNGDGTLGKQNSYAMNGFPGGAFGSASSGIVLGDFNGDKKLDVAAGFQTSPGNANSGGVSVLLGNGDGTLRPAVTYGGGSASVYSLVAGDFNGDGKLDLAAGAGTDQVDGGVLMVLLGNGDGTFQAAKNISVGSPAGVPSAIAAADVNGDGKLDLVVGDCCGYSESVYLLGQGDGTFQAPQYFASGSSAQAFAVTSWNNDGVVGLAVAHEVGSVMAMEALPLSGVITASTNVTSAAGGVLSLAPGSLASAYGADLANGAPNSTTLPWPPSFEGTSIAITDSTGAKTPAPLTYVSQGQVNFQIPDTVPAGPVTMAVTSGDGTVSTAQATLTKYAPALFTLNASNLAAAVAICVSSSGAQTAEYPYQVVSGAIVALPLNLGACAQTVLELYGTGIDAATASNTQVSMNGVSAPVLFAGPQQTYPGLDQINITIPKSLAGTGSVSIVMTVAGTASNTVNITVQ